MWLALGHVDEDEVVVVADPPDEQAAAVAAQGTEDRHSVSSRS